MDKETLTQLLKSNDVLVETNSRLVNINETTVNIIKSTIEEKEQLLSVCREIYEGLDDKSQKNLVEQIWHSGLHNILNKKDESSK
jgi:hypothetical protein